MSFKPLNGYLLLKSDTQEDKSPGGVLIPENAQQQSKFGVVRVSADSYIENGIEVELNVTEGTRVMFNPHSAIDVTVAGEEYLLVHSKSIYGFIEGSHLK